MPLRNEARHAPALASLLATASVLAQYVAAPGVHPISGRRFANVMGRQGADGSSDPQRALERRRQGPRRARHLTGITVADVGAGSGYFTVRLGARVGPNGRVHRTTCSRTAEDARRPPRPRERRERHPRPGHRRRCEAASGTHPSGADGRHLRRVLEPQKMLRQIRTASKPGGRLVLLVYRKRPEKCLYASSTRCPLPRQGRSSRRRGSPCPELTIGCLASTSVLFAK